jgi:hypothetical protein
MSAKPYERLPGKGSSLTAYHRLYLGADHLLAMESAGFMEGYRRFFFRDIQAFQITRTVRGRIANVVFGILAGSAILPASVAADGVAAAALGIVGGVFALLLLVNVALGPTCRCQVQTPVQTYTLRSLNRLRSTRKVLARIQPLIEAAQTDPAAAAPAAPGDGALGEPPAAPPSPGSPENPAPEAAT